MPDSKDPFAIEAEKPEPLAETAAGPPRTSTGAALPQNVAAEGEQSHAATHSHGNGKITGESGFESRRRQLAADKIDGTLIRDRARRITKVKPGDPAAVRLRDLAARDMASAPTLAELEIIAPANGMPLESLTACETCGEVLSKVLAWRAMLGQIPAVQEIHDRLDPKVQRVEADVTARPMAPHGDNEAENAAAAAFFEELDD